MPDTLSLTTGVSLGLLAGIVSGVCYLVANGITWSRDEEVQKKCIASTRHRDIFCSRCGGDLQGGPIPCICEHHKPVKFESDAWFLRQVQRGLSLMPWSVSTEKLEQIEEECEPGASSSAGRGDLQSVREFLEALSAKLAGGPLEGTRVAALYDHPSYLPQSNAISSASSTRSTGASGAHAQLKRLVARVVEEAAALPALARYAAEPHTPTEASTYEDLLATAILNKVIERYQTENGSGGRSSGIHSASASPSPSERSSPRSLTRNTRDITPPLREEVDVSDWEEGCTEDALEVPRRVPFPEFGGDIVHHTDNEDRDFDEVSSSDIQAADGSWEENWLFQKKKIKTIQSVPVPMLVPNSNTEYRALIGDRDAEDTTDLSDNASDAEEQSEEFKSDVKRVLDSKHVIGGKPKVDALDFEPDSLMSVDGTDDFEKLYNEYNQSEDTVDAVNTKFVENGNSNNEKVNGDLEENLDNKNDSILIVGVDSGPLPKAEFNVKEEIHRTLNGNAEAYIEDLNHSASQALDTSITEDHNYAANKDSTNTLSRHEREGEYEETVSVPVQRYADSLRRKHFEDEPQQNSTPSVEKEEELIPGSIAYRERKKWLNYVEMPNNPYSPEAIKKRLSAKSTSSLFDTLTKSKDFDDDKIEIPDTTQENGDINGHANNTEEKNLSRGNSALSVSTGNISMNDRRSVSPSPKVLKHAMTEDSPQYKRYGRDYYIKEAKTSTGGRNTSSYSDTCSLTSSMNKSTSLDNFETEFASPRLLIKQFNTIATNQQYTNFAGKDQTQNSITMPHDNKDEILIEYEDVNDQTLFSAKPVYVDEDTDKQFEEILQSAYNTEITPLTITIDKPHDEPEKSPNSISANSNSSSSIEDSIKIYNVQTGEIVKCKPEDKVSPRYEQAPDRNDNINMPDKNIPGETIDRLSANDGVGEVTVQPIEERLPQISEIDEILQHLPKVKELAKKFVSMDNLSEPAKPPPQPYVRRRKSRENLLNADNDRPTNKTAYMHSLTARSISKEFRDELKLSMATPLTVPGGSKEIPEGTEEVTKESSRPGSPLPEPGSIKTKLAFFESLKSKFSTKRLVDN
ncbi:uncharacterized protein M7BP isoform X2 [Epargyreus clarus]|uniref:uncharacterized protein M7BP isoform X2 n=1 Tax=Epargyreus clarus TaxID=520877 RepID=UPI003C2F134B